MSNGKESSIKIITWAFIALVSIWILSIIVKGFLSSGNITDLKNQIALIEKKNDSLTETSKELLKKVKATDVLMAQKTNKIDSLIQTDSINKKNLKIISWKYAKLKNDYAGLSDAGKWAEFDSLTTD